MVCQADFSAGQQVTNLKVLKLGAMYEHVQPLQPLLGPGDVDHLVPCCPSLQQVCLEAAIEQGVQPTALSQLTRLTSAKFSGNCVDDSWVTGVLMHLTGLQNSVIRESSSFTGTGLVQLQRLTHLTQLTHSCLMLSGVCHDLKGSISAGTLKLRDEFQVRIQQCHMSHAAAMHDLMPLNTQHTCRYVDEACNRFAPCCRAVNVYARCLCSTACSRRSTRWMYWLFVSLRSPLGPFLSNAGCLGAAAQLVPE